MNRNHINQFWKKRSAISHPRISTHFKEDDCHIYDLRLIRKYIDKHSKILDLACGPCFYANKLVNEVKLIKAVDKFRGFFKYCDKANNLQTVQADLLTYRDTGRYDLILLLGIMHFFNSRDRMKIYRNCRNMLSQKGCMIVRHQCGLNSDIYINKYSPEIGDHYQAMYLWVKKEIHMLQKFYTVEVLDIFPKRLNRWKDSHYFAFVCHKK